MDKSCSWILFFSIIVLVKIRSCTNSIHETQYDNNQFAWSSDSSEYEKDPCLVQYCGTGYECVSKNGTANCICQRECVGNHKIVCGSDGKFYSSLCEIHRRNCLHGNNVTNKEFTLCEFKGNDYTNVNVRNNILDVNNISAVPKKSIVNLVNGNQLTLNKERQCSMKEYEIMKESIMVYYQQRIFGENNNQDKDYVISNIFNHYDYNNDGLLTVDELQKVNKYLEFRGGCSFMDIFEYDDTNKDGILNLNEFYVAFGKLYSISVVSLDKKLEINRIEARINDELEMKCDVTGSPVTPIVWQRNYLNLALLKEDNIHVLNDGSLYLTKVQYFHAGNYTCHAQRNPDVVQTHIVTVYGKPKVYVSPKLQYKRPNEDAKMICRVTGEPFPKVEWLKNDEPLLIESENKITFGENEMFLLLKKIDFADTGAYVCQATNKGGIERNVTSLVVQQNPIPFLFEDENHLFAFHSRGISIYETIKCRLHHKIQSTDVIPGKKDFVCGSKMNECKWGNAINVGDHFIYASQPNLDRILVLSTIQMIVVEVIKTDSSPVQLNYIAHLDQVWVLNWYSANDSGVKTIEVIREASHKQKHYTVHPIPFKGKFNIINKLFIPLSHQEFYDFQFSYGYVTHYNQHNLYKIDLENMRHIRAVNLTNFNCIPTNIQFSILYGFVIIECTNPSTHLSAGQIILDYLTDTVLWFETNLSGHPYVSPDSRKLIVLDHTPNGTIIVVFNITNDGLKFLFDIKTTLNVSDLEFYPSTTSHGYDVYATAQDKEDILYLNMMNGKVEIIANVGPPISASLILWNKINRPLSHSGFFGKYLASPSNKAVYIINGDTHAITCQLNIASSIVVWSKNNNTLL